MNSDRMKAHFIYTLWLAKWYFYANQLLLLHASYRAGNVDDCAYFGNPFQFFSKLHFTFPYRFHLANWKFFFISFFFFNIDWIFNEILKEILWYACVWDWSILTILEDSSIRSTYFLLFPSVFLSHSILNEQQQRGAWNDWLGKNCIKETLSCWDRHTVKNEVFGLLRSRSFDLRRWFIVIDRLSIFGNDHLIDSLFSVWLISYWFIHSFNVLLHYFCGIKLA